MIAQRCYPGTSLTDIGVDLDDKMVVCARAVVDQREHLAGFAHVAAINKRKKKKKKTVMLTVKLNARRQWKRCGMQTLDASNRLDRYPLFAV